MHDAHLTRAKFNAANACHNCGRDLFNNRDNAVANASRCIIPGACSVEPLYTQNQQLKYAASLCSFAASVVCLEATPLTKVLGAALRLDIAQIGRAHV